MLSIIITLLALGFVIFIHELGHLLAAKRANVGVSEFAIGMGPKLVSFDYGDTMYSLRLFPFGGFIKAQGMDGEASGPIELDYRQKSAWSKARILAAGSVMNILLGWVLFTIIAGVNGTSSISPRIDAVQSGLPADIAGLQSGDTVTAVNGQPIQNLQQDLISFVKNSNGDVFQLTFIRDSASKTVTLSAVESDGRFQVGVAFTTLTTPMAWPKAIVFGLTKTWATIGQSFSGIKMLLAGNASVNELAGPVGIVQIASSQIQKSAMSFLNLMAFISISLGMINLLPFPVLDGGHLLFLLIETLRGKPLEKKIEGIVTNVAAGLLIGLMVFIVFNDIIRWDDRVTIIKEMQK
ncbi:MAG: RIP metalloprotease RseP [Candidatus Marinamargulisbacteria bacterium]